jgi:L-malate glycosyltransferase
MPTKPKKILLFTDTPLLGGAEHQMYLLAKSLDRRKFTPIICCGPSEKLNDWVKKLKNEKIATIRLEIEHKNDPKQFKILKNLIKEEKIDIVHANLWNPASCRFVFLAARATKTPLIVTEHDTFKLNFIKNIFKSRLTSYASTIITPSNKNKKLFKKLHPGSAKKIKVIHNGVDTTWWKSQLISFGNKDRTDIRLEKFQAQKEDLVILTAAALNPHKGLHHYLKAIQLLIEKLTTPPRTPNLRFIIAGDGPQKETLQKLIAKRGLEEYVELIGHQSNMPKLMKSSDIFVLPSERESFGLVVTEAMLSDLPVIASKVGGIPEIITDDKTGLLVPTQNPEQLSTTLQKLISSKPLRKRLAKSAKSHVEKNFTIEKMARAYEKEYSKLV